MAYKLISNDKNARAGTLTLNNIEVQTPTFMPVATRGAIKSTPHQYLDKTSILLANAYHLHLRPGAQLINDLGGLHKFMNWDKLILTDSGGFQAWSLPTKLLNDGIEFNFKNLSDSVENDFSSATDLADYLVGKGVPFRTAYQVVGQIVKYCMERKVLFKNLKIDEFKNFHPEFDEDVFVDLEPFNVVKSRTSQGGTGFEQVEKEINNWQKRLLL